MTKNKLISLDKLEPILISAFRVNFDFPNLDSELANEMVQDIKVDDTNQTVEITSGIGLLNNKLILLPEYSFIRDKVIEGQIEIVNESMSGFIFYKRKYCGVTLIEILNSNRLNNLSYGSDLTFKEITLRFSYAYYNEKYS